jgi:DNA-formamidopyrimidine glycosylase/squalene synthase HpnD
MPDLALSSTLIARRAKSNLAFALACLPAQRRRDMISFYAFCRVVDDIADSSDYAEADRRAQLHSWRHAVLTGAPSHIPVLDEVTRLPAKYHFPPQWLAEIIDGVASDLTHERYATFEDLLAYCYKVASVVGLVSVHIFGHRSPAAADYAVQLGYALQLTNILRDIGQDARDTGRIYLPLEDLARFGVTEQDVLSGRHTPEFTRLMDFEYARAIAYYDRAEALLPPEDRHTLLASRMMGQIYREILEKLKRTGYPVFAQRCRLHPLRKGIILLSYISRGWLTSLPHTLLGREKTCWAVRPFGPCKPPPTTSPPAAMPELPEVETTLRGITPHLLRHRIREVIVRDRRLRWPVSADLHSLEGQPVTATRRRAKYLLITTPAGTLLIHLGMSGALRIVDPATPFRRHDHVAFTLSTGLQLRLHDPRRFGAVLLIQGPPEKHPLLASLGPEPLGPAFTPDYLAGRCAGRTAPIKAVIMDSHSVVGVGNIYACEALFIAGIHPARPAGKVTKPRLAKLIHAIRQVLLASIESGGTTLRDFLNEKGEPGYFAQSLRVYDREGEPCLKCGSLVKRVVMSNRSTFYCPKCQR